MKALKNTWNTLIDTFHVVGRYRRDSLYPLLAFVIVLLVTFVALLPLFQGVLGAGQSGLARLWFFLAVYLAYGLLYFVSAFGNVALLYGIGARLDGREVGLAAGLARAWQRIGLIGSYTLVSATLGLLSFLARTLVSPLFGMVIAPSVSKQLWVRWQQLSYSYPLLMELPIIALDQPAPKDAFKRGDQLIKQTWGERVKPAHSINLLALLVLLPVILLVATPMLQQGAAEGDADMIRLGMAIMLVAISTYTQLSGLVNAIFALAAYRYATAGKRDLFPGDPTYAERAFVVSEKDTSAASPSDHSPAVADDPR
jgi:hypothetical protein